MRRNVIDRVYDLVSRSYDLIRECEDKLDVVLVLGEEELDQDLLDEVEEVLDLLKEARDRMDYVLDELNENY